MAAHNENLCRASQDDLEGFQIFTNLRSFSLDQNRHYFQILNSLYLKRFWRRFKVFGNNVKNSSRAH